MIEPLYLTNKDIEMFKKRHLELGRGTDGIVYKTGNFWTRDELYKLYHSNNLLDVSGYKQEFDSDGVNIANNKVIFREEFASDSMCYYDKENVKVAKEDAIYKVVQRQENILRTFLQKRPIYIHNHFAGDVLHYHRCCIPISYLKGYPLRLKLWVLKELLYATKELIDNNIYHVDLKINPDEPKTDNILISLGIRPTPHIIDVDGKSAIYTEVFNQKYTKRSLLSYKGVLLEVIFNINLEKCENEDFFYLEEMLKQDGFSSDIVEGILNSDKLLDYNELSEVLDDIKDVKLKTKRFY